LNISTKIEEKKELLDVAQKGDRTSLHGHEKNMTNCRAPSLQFFCMLGVFNVNEKREKEAIKRGLWN
jgi:hypothetical protein